MESLGIPMVHDLPGVGQNLRDHPLVALQFQVRPEYLDDPDAPWSQVALRYTSGRFADPQRYASAARLVCRCSRRGRR